jgi:hypothetical protein
MPVLVTGIHVFPAEKQDVDGRAKPGHDGNKPETLPLPALSFPPSGACS